VRLGGGGVGWVSAEAGGGDGVVRMCVDEDVVDWGRAVSRVVFAGLGTGPVGFGTSGWAGGVWWSWGNGVGGGGGGGNGCGWGVVIRRW